MIDAVDIKMPLIYNHETREIRDQGGALLATLTKEINQTEVTPGIGHAMALSFYSQTMIKTLVQFYHGQETHHPYTFKQLMKDVYLLAAAIPEANLQTDDFYPKCSSCKFYQKTTMNGSDVDHIGICVSKGLSVCVTPTERKDEKGQFTEIANLKTIYNPDKHPIVVKGGFGCRFHQLRETE